MGNSDGVSDNGYILSLCIFCGVLAASLLFLFFTWLCARCFPQETDTTELIQEEGAANILPPIFYTEQLEDPLQQSDLK